MEIAIKHNGIQNLSASLGRLQASLAVNTTALQAAIKGLELTGGDSAYTQRAKEGLTTRLQAEQARYSAVQAAQKSIDTFVQNARAADARAASLVTQTQDQFLQAHPWLKPEPKKPWYQYALEGICNACKTICGTVEQGFRAAVQWVKDHKVELLIGAATTAAAVVLTVLSGGTLGAVGLLLKGVLVTAGKLAATSAVIGGIKGGLENGWGGVLGGAAQGFSDGLAQGFAFGGVGALGQSIARAVDWVKRGGKLTLRNFSPKTYTQADYLNAPRPGALSDPEVLPEDRLKHITSPNADSGGHLASNTIEGGQAIGDPRKIIQIPEQPNGVYDVINEVGKPKTCWPGNYGPTKLLNSLDEAYKKVVGQDIDNILFKGAARVAKNGDTRIGYVVKLSDGILANLVLKNNKQIVTFYPIGMKFLYP